MAKPIGILRFPGTNCDRDVWHAMEAMDLEPRWLWHEDHFKPGEYSGFVIPGGFSYGDYLRCGALAAKAPAMGSLAEAVKAGMPVLGICNGFQILCESKLLPGALVRNVGRRFIDRWVELKAVKSENRVRLPIAHGEGRFVMEEGELNELFERGQVWWTYSENPNGSLRDIAGVTNAEGNVWGMMPHPERAMFEWMGSEDGRGVFSVLTR